jgi:hypothetical protein
MTLMLLKRLVLISISFLLMAASSPHQTLQGLSNSRAVSKPVKPSQSAQPNKTSNQDERGTEQHPLFVKALSSSNRAAETTQAEKEREEISTNRRIAFWTQISSIVAGLVFIAGVGQIALFYWQLRLIRKSLDDAKKSADAAVEANTLNREIFVANNRPWIAVEGMGFKKFFSLRTSGVESQCSVALRNIGKSPAEEMDVDADFLFEDGRIASALKQHIDRFNFVIKNIVGFRIHKNASIFSMYPSEVVNRDASINTQIIGDLKRARVFCSVIVTYRNPGAEPWCASARLYQVTYTGTNSIEDFEFRENQAFQPNFVNAKIVYEGNLTT